MEWLFYVSYGVLWVVVFGLAILVILLYRHFGLASLGTLDGVQRDGISIGELAPELTGVSSENRPFVWEPPASSSVLLFATLGCEPCARVLPAFQLLSTTLPDLDLMVVVSGTSKTAQELAAKFNLRVPCIADDGSDTRTQFRVRVTPFAFVIGPDRRVRAKGLCSDPLRLSELLAQGGLAQASQIASDLARSQAIMSTALVQPEGVGHG